MSPAPASRALVIGESLVDVVERPGSAPTAHAGGSPLNVAFGLARLGVPVTFATEYGADAYGSLLAAHLGDAGVTTINLSHGEATSVATARIDAQGTARYDFSLTWDFDAPALPAAELVHTGSIGALREPGATAVRRLIEELHDDTVVSFDPNVRPALIGEPAQARELVDWYSRHAHLVKLSDEDAGWLFPGWEPRAVLDWVLERGAAVAVVTLGAEGSILRSRTSEAEIEAVPTRVVDTIGAGDAYMAGLVAGAVHADLLARLRRGDVSEDSLRALGGMAASVAALTVARAGAVPPTLDEVRALGTTAGLQAGS
ncbi:carbohydrate kinase family protein [Leifsonia xyli]|uniref:carbohydrate kinase family protein n=1 Tax=Leifsonia xyli TaxID=1575 RepID=UPI003D66D1E3